MNDLLKDIEPLLKYQLQRKPEYPSLADQLDALWKGGQAAEEMKLKIDAVKTKYPKPLAE
jgi:hypothetical protein